MPASEQWPKPWSQGIFGGGLALLGADGEVISFFSQGDGPLLDCIIADHNALAGREPEAAKEALDWMEKFYGKGDNGIYVCPLILPDILSRLRPKGGQHEA